MNKRAVSWILVLCFVLFANYVFANELNTEMAVVDGKTSDRVHLRERPAIDSKSYGLYFTGTPVQSEPYTNQEWVWVSIGTQSGYMKTEFLQFGANANNVTSKQPLGVVSNNNNNTWTNLRRDPSLNADVVKRLYNGDSVTVLGETVTKWYYVKSGDVYGYIKDDFLSLSGSVSPGNHTSPPVPTAPPAPTSPPSSGTAILDAYRSVLHNNMTFTNSDTNQSMYLSQLISSFTDVSMQIPYFALVDLDRDTIPEVILRETVNGTDYGVVVLHYQDGIVYGYSLYTRGFMQLKIDGTFSYSSGAGDNGFGRMSFNRNSYTINPQAYCQTNADGSISYFVNQAPSTADAYSAALDGQERKSDASWYEFSADSVDVVISGYRWGT